MKHDACDASIQSHLEWIQRRVGMEQGGGEACLRSKAALQVELCALGDRNPVPFHWELNALQPPHCLKGAAPLITSELLLHTDLCVDST